MLWCDRNSSLLEGWPGAGMRHCRHRKRRPCKLATMKRPSRFAQLPRFFLETASRTQAPRRPEAVLQSCTSLASTLWSLRLQAATWRSVRFSAAGLEGRRGHTASQALVGAQLQPLMRTLQTNLDACQFGGVVRRSTRDAIALFADTGSNDEGNAPPAELVVSSCPRCLAWP